MKNIFDKPINPKAFAELTRQLSEYVELEEVGTIIALVHSKDEIIYQNKFGFQNIEKQIPIEYNSIFRFYSMTKPIVAVAALQLWEQGKLKLSDPVSKFIPKFKNLKVFKQKTDSGFEVEDLNREITVLDIFTHTAGLSYGGVSNDPIEKKYIEVWDGVTEKSLEELIDGFLDIPLKYQPGTKWHYSISIDVLGLIVEIISRKKLDVYLKKNIFDKLDMIDTGFYVPEKLQSRFVTLYTASNDTLVEVHNPETDRYLSPVSFLSGGGGLVSTLNDYLIFCKMLLNKGELNGNRLLLTETVDKMITNHLSDDIPPMDMDGDTKSFEGIRSGLGVAVKVSDNNGLFSVGSYYWGGAALTSFIIDPNAQSICILLSQYAPRSHKNHISDNFYKLAGIAIKNQSIDLP